MNWIRLESPAYWIVAVVTFLGVAYWESMRPKRPLSVSTERRWGNHAVILVMSTVAVGLLYRTSPVLVAASFAGNRFGLLNKMWLPFAARFVLALLLLDFVKYLAHRFLHSVPVMWRMHQVHHSDPDFDVSTALRVHPLELIFTQGVYLGIIAILAPPLSAVVLAEALSGLQSFFGHANARLPGWIEGPLRTIFITPDMHRIHHSAEVAEQLANFGDSFPWWDRLLGTYVATPAAGQDGMVM